MPEANFDPYHKWLGVPPKEQPANHYRLLGIQLFESDPDVIESAATRQITHVRSFAIGKHGELSQAILNEIAEAKLCLLLPERKREYDNSLNKPHSVDQPVETVHCPACDASLAINKTLYGKLAKCPKCTATCRISVDGKQASEESGVNESEGNSLFDALPKSEIQASAGTFTGVAGPKRKSTKVSRKKKTTLNWIVVVAVPTGAICGIALAVVLLWVLFKKDPLGIMVADAPARQFLETPREPSTNTTVNQEATKAPHSRLGESDKAGLVQQTNGPRPSPAVAPFDAAKAKQHQDAWADYLGVTVENTNSIGMKFVVIPPGEFMMDFYYKVRLTEPFHFGMHEVTQEQYQQVMGKNPSQNPSSHNPIEQVSWKEALDFCRRLSSLPEEVMAGNEYRLPTEAEWEYACRAGSTTKYSFGDSYTRMSGYGWAGHNSGRKTHPVGQKKPNPWGLYDVHGNVWEWCHDRRGDYPSGEVVNPTGASSGHRVYRGGGCGDHPKYSESGVRNSGTEDYRRWDQGFRVVRTRSDQTLKRQDKRTSQKSSLELMLAEDGLWIDSIKGPENARQSAGQKDTPPPAKLLSVDDMLDRKISVVFDQESLNYAVDIVVNAVHRDLPSGSKMPKIRIIPGDLHLIGITQSQQVRDFKQVNVGLRKVLTELVRRANPDKTATGPKDRRQHLIWVVAEDAADSGFKEILITTRKAATGKYELPVEFRTE